jgi:ribosomal protein S18 acetylase RimI-like enzyme
MTQNERFTPEPDSPLRVHLASRGDRTSLIPLINSAFSIETFMEGTRTDDERLAAMMQKGDILVVEDGAGSLLACVYAEVRGMRGYLGQLAVAPGHQGKGLGRSLVEAAEDHLRRQGCEAVDITVLSLRPELPPLYRRFGYVETGREAFTRCAVKSGTECHCIVMSKQI